MLMGPLRPDENEFYCRKLLEEHYVCVMDPANPLAAAPLTIDGYATCKHTTVTYGGNWRSGYLVALERLGLSHDHAVKVPSPAGLEQMIVGTDLVATIPSRLAAVFGPSIHVAKCPCPAPFEIHLVWTMRTHHSAMHVWLRTLILEVVRTSFPRI